MSAAQTATAVDAFTAEVIRNAVVAITREMKTNLMRTAYSSIIYEAEDFTVGLFDADGHTISIGLGLPMFIRGLSDAIKAKIAHWGKENIVPGDILRGAVGAGASARAKSLPPLLIVAPRQMPPHRQGESPQRCCWRHAR